MRFDHSQAGGHSEKPPTGRKTPDSSAPLIPMNIVQRINHLVGESEESEEKENGLNP
jgi:hypothetical protein